MKSIELNLPEKEYFTHKAASNSTLGRMKRSAAHCLEYMENPIDPTPNMLFGSLVHKLVLEGNDAFDAAYYIAKEDDPKLPRNEDIRNMVTAIQSDKFDEQFVLNTDSVSKPRSEGVMAIVETLMNGETQQVLSLYETTPTDINKRTKEGKAKYAEFQAMCEREGKTIVKQEELDTACEYANWLLIVGERTIIKEFDKVVADNYANYLKHVGNRIICTEDNYSDACSIRNSIQYHPAASKLFANGAAETSIFWQDPDTGEDCKARLDFTNTSEIIVDLKTTADASLDQFGKSIANFGYHRQAAMYSDGYEAVHGKPPKAFVFVAVESKPPFAVGVYNLDAQGIEKGREEYKALLSEFGQCKKSGIWPAYSEKVETIELPRWYK